MTIQIRKELTTIPLPDLQGSSLCPVTALRTPLQVSPGDSNSPVFVIPRQKKWVPLPDSVASKHVKDICKALGLHKALTFHTTLGGLRPLGPFIKGFHLKTS